MEYIHFMEWAVEFDEDFSLWFEDLELKLQEELIANFKVLATVGPTLGRPRVDSLKNSKHPNMKELRIQYKGTPWRIIFAFDPERKAILLVGGDKTNDERFYRINIPLADARFDKHLEELKRSKRAQKRKIK
jgi:hypothetical protein